MGGMQVLKLFHDAAHKSKFGEERTTDRRGEKKWISHHNTALEHFPLPLSLSLSTLIALSPLQTAAATWE